MFLRHWCTIVIDATYADRNIAVNRGKSEETKPGSFQVEIESRSGMEPVQEAESHCMGQRSHSHMLRRRAHRL